jgi:hypothetical protein
MGLGGSAGAAPKRPDVIPNVPTNLAVDLPGEEPRKYVALPLAASDKAKQKP